MFIQKYKQALGVIASKPIMLWGLSLLSGIIGFIASLATAPIFALSFAASVLLQCGMVKVYLDGLKGRQVNSNQLFAAFNKNCVRTVGGMAWMNLWIIIWCLVPIVGPIVAIVKAYSYSFVPYILMTRPEVTATDALRLSMYMTKGKKGQMFLADLCFYLGIGIASLILGLLASIPYIGFIFGIVMFIFGVLVFLFSSIFVGLYKAAFYNDSVQVPRDNA